MMRVACVHEPDAYIPVNTCTPHRREDSLPAAVAPIQGTSAAGGRPGGDVQRGEVGGVCGSVTQLMYDLRAQLS